MKNYKKTIIGSCILFILLLLSCFYSYIGPADFNHRLLVKDASGKVILPPFPPSKEHLLGTSRNNEDLFWLLLYGAKYTLFTAFIVAALRVFFGGIAGIFLSLWAPFLKSYFKDFFLSFRYIPAILIAYLLMVPIVGGFNDTPIATLAIYQMLILVFIGFPSVTLLSSDLTNELLKSSFVQSSYLMGASKLHVAKRHLLPYMRSYSILFTVQQLVNTLQTMMHLGILGLFLGGLNRAGVLGYEKPAKPATLTNEWAGLIGQNFDEFILAPWVGFIPVIAFFIVIAIINMMKKEMEDNLQFVTPLKKKRKKVPLPSIKYNSANTFELVDGDQRLKEKSI